MNDKVAKYIIAGVKAEMQKEVEKVKKKNTEDSNNLHRWWKEEEIRADGLEAENTALKAELEEAKKVIAGYKQTMEQELGINKNINLTVEPIKEEQNA